MHKSIHTQYTYWNATQSTNTNEINVEHATITNSEHDTLK